MDLSRTKSDSNDFIDLMNPPPPAEDQDEETPVSALDSTNKKPDILPNYDFHPIRPTSASALSSFSTDSATAMGGGDSAAATAGSKPWGSDDSQARAPSPISSYSYLRSLEHDKVVMEKSQKVDGAEILSEIDVIMKKHTDNLVHAIDSLSARLSQLESRTRQIEHSVDDLKESIGNNYGSTDGKMRQLENILREVQFGVQDLKDKQEVMETQMRLGKLQIPKVEQTVEAQTTASNVDPSGQQQQPPSSAPQQPPYSTQQQQQYPVPSPLSSSLPVFSPPNAPPPPSQQQSIHPLPSQPPSNQYSTIPSLPQQDAAYYPPPSQPQEVLGHQYLQQPHQQQSLPLPSPPQHPQYQSGLPPAPYQQALQPPQHQAPPAGNPSPQFQPPVGNRSDETAYIPSGPSQSFPSPNISQPTGGPPPSSSQQYYGVPPSQVYDPVPSGRSSSGFPSQAYAPPQSPTSELYSPYSGSLSRYSMKPLPHSPTGGSNYPQIPTAKPLPQAIPTASMNSGGSGGTHPGGNGNRVPIEDVIDKVTSMGFPRDHVRATVRRLTENGQSVDLNVVLDKLMNEGQGDGQRAWFGH